MKGLRVFIKHVFRYFKKEIGYTSLNILGLSIGISAFIMAMLYVRYETTYDDHHEKKDRLFRISADIKEKDNDVGWAITQYPLGNTLKSNFPEVEEFARLLTYGITHVELENESFVEENFFFVDSTLLGMFSFDFLQGDSHTALHSPNSIVLSKTMAHKYFGIENPIGRRIKIDNENIYQVTGVYADMPKKAHFFANALISANANSDLRTNNNWSWFEVYTYVLLTSAEKANGFEKKLSQIAKDYVDPIFKPNNIHIRYKLINIKDIHLHSDCLLEPMPTGNIFYVYAFTGIGLFMLIISNINFINLSTARASRRALEVGIKKILGATRVQLACQFIAESLLLSLSALFVGMIGVSLLIPTFNQLLGLDLKIYMLISGPFLVFLLSIIFLVGVLGSTYPALFLSNFKPIHVLQAKYGKSLKKDPLRKILVVVQLSVSIILIIGTGIIYEQLNFVKNQELGFDKEQVLAIPFTIPAQKEKWLVLRNAFLKLPNVLAAGTASSIPAYSNGKNVMSIELEGGAFEERGVENYQVDYDYLETVGIKLIHGRGFSSEFKTDSNFSALVNESMVQRMGWKEPLGKRLRVLTDYEISDTSLFFTVIGVINDYHHRSLYDPISPIVILPGFNNNVGMVKIKDNGISETLSQLEIAWQNIFPGSTFEYYFLDEKFQRQYDKDEKRGMIFFIFSGLSILIACIGLMGLASYLSGLRAKEIVIRKVLGAKTGSLVGLMTKEYFWLLAIASIPSFIIAWYMMNQWLENFSYRIDIDPQIFVVSFFLIGFITILTTGIFSLKVVLQNPAEILKRE